MPCAVLLGCSLLAPSAKAQELVKIGLDWSEPRGFGQCPSREDFEASVVKRMGVDPFDDDAIRRVTLELKTDEPGLTVSIRITEDGRLLGVRRFTSEQPDCREAFETAALMLSMALVEVNEEQEDEVEAEPEPPVAEQLESEPSATDQHAADPSQRTADEPRVTTPLSWTLGVGPHLATGFSPGWSPGATLHAEVKGSQWSLQAELLSELPGETVRSDGTGIRSWYLAASLAPCMHFAQTFLCAVARAGGLRGEGTGIALVRSGWAPTGHLGLRTGLSVVIWRWLGARAYIDVGSALARARISIDGTSRWSSPPFAGAGTFLLTGAFQ